MHFDHPTYVIMPIQPPVADQVLALRQRYGYPLTYPVEVTVAGSSGIGVLATDQDPVDVLEKLRAVAAETVPFVTSYGEVRRFPQTNIFWFSLRDEAPFRAIHQRLKNCCNYRSRARSASPRSPWPQRSGGITGNWRAPFLGAPR